MLASPLTASVTVQLVEANRSVTFSQFVAVSDAIYGAKRLFKGTVDLSTTEHGTYTLSLAGADTATRAGAAQITPSLNYNLILQPQILNNRALPPSGVRILRHRDFCRIEWVVPSEFGFQGVRVLFSTDESGITIPYQQFGSLVSNVTRISREIFDSSSASVEDTQYATVTTTKIDQYVDVNYGSVDIDRATVGSDEFFVSLSTVILDAATNHVFESQANGPFKCGFVDLRKVNPTDFIALQDQSDIAGRLITYATEKRPDLDLSPRSDARDVFIDPVSVQRTTQAVNSPTSRYTSSLASDSDPRGGGEAETLRYAKSVASSRNITLYERYSRSEIGPLDDSGSDQTTAQPSAAAITWLAVITSKPLRDPETMTPHPTCPCSGCDIRTAVLIAIARTSSLLNPMLSDFGRVWSAVGNGESLTGAAEAEFTSSAACLTWSLSPAISNVVPPQPDRLAITTKLIKPSFIRQTSGTLLAPFRPIYFFFFASSGSEYFSFCLP